jgi:hypothetical protein
MYIHIYITGGRFDYVCVVMCVCYVSYLVVACYVNRYRQYLLYSCQHNTVWRTWRLLSRTFRKVCAIFRSGF